MVEVYIPPEEDGKIHFKNLHLPIDESMPI